MAISFSCKCGKKLQAREEFAGRKMKCPTCQAVLTIPGEKIRPPEPREIKTEESSPEEEALAAITQAAFPGPAAEVPLARPTAPQAAALLQDFSPPDEPRKSKAVSSPPTSPANPWVDRSFEQTITPWTGDDESRFKTERDVERGFPLVMVLVLLVLLGGGAAVWYFWKDIAKLF